MVEIRKASNLIGRWRLAALERRRVVVLPGLPGSRPLVVDSGNAAREDGVEDRLHFGTGSPDHDRHRWPELARPEIDLRLLRSCDRGPAGTPRRDCRGELRPDVRDDSGEWSRGKNGRDHPIDHAIEHRRAYRRFEALAEGADVELTVDDPIVHSAADRRLEVVRDLLRELVERRLERLERPRLERLLDGVVDLLPRLLDRFDLRNVLGEVR